MSENVYRVKNKNSSVLIDGQPKLPTAEQMEYGEIAVNYAASGETLSIKNSNNRIVTFSCDDKFNKSFDTIEDNIETISGETENIIQKIENNDIAIAGALNGLNDKINNLESSATSLNTRVGTLESSATSADTRLTKLESSATSVNTRLNNLETSATSVNTRVTNLEPLARRTRLTSFSLDVLKQAVAEQNLEKYGLKVGDETTINGYTYVIAGLNPMAGTYTPYTVNVPHVGLIVIPHTTQAWNVAGNTYTGADGRGAGYKNCDLHYYLKNTTLPHVQNDLGSGNLISHYKLLSSNVNTTGYNRYGTNTGCASSSSWESNCYISALSEIQVYGSIVWSSAGCDTGEACRQLDVFRVYNMNEIFKGEYPWLRDIASASRAACVYNYGYATYTTSSSAPHVAALILFH